jgi:hypothetical protein
MCLAEQLAHTYTMAKTELIEPLCFTLSGFSSYAEPLSDMVELDSSSEVVVEPPTYDIPDQDPKLKSVLKSNVQEHKHICDSKSAAETLLVPSGSTGSGESFIRHAGVGDLSEDPCNSTTKCNVMRPCYGHSLSPPESITSEREVLNLFVSECSCDDSDEVDSNSDEVEDDGGGKQGKNLNQEEREEEEEEENGKVKEEEKPRGLNESLNCDAEGNSCHKEDALARMTAPAEEVQLFPTASECNVFGKECAIPQLLYVNIYFLLFYSVFSVLATYL